MLGQPSPEVDPLADEVVALAADLLATQRIVAGLRPGWPPRRSASPRGVLPRRDDHPKARTMHGAFVLVNPVVEQATRWERGARAACPSPT